MGGPDSSQPQVPNVEEGEEVEDGVETLSLCDLALCGNDDVAVECGLDGCSGQSSTTSSEEHDQELFEFSSGELSFASTQRAEKIMFCGRIIHFREQPPPALLRVAKSPGKDDQERNVAATMRKTKRRKFFRWKLRLFRRRRTGYRRMRSVEGISSLKQEQRQGPVDLWGVKGKWYFLMFGSARVPIEMGLQDIKMRQTRRSKPPRMFGFSDYTEAEMDDEIEKSCSRNSWGLLKILRSLSWGSSRPRNHGDAVVKVSSGCIPRR